MPVDYPVPDVNYYEPAGSRHPTGKNKFNGLQGFTVYRKG